MVPGAEIASHAAGECAAEAGVSASQQPRDLSPTLAGRPLIVASRHTASPLAPPRRPVPACQGQAAVLQCGVPVTLSGESIHKPRGAIVAGTPTVTSPVTPVFCLSLWSPQATPRIGRTLDASRPGPDAAAHGGTSATSPGLGRGQARSPLRCEPVATARVAGSAQERQGGAQRAAALSPTGGRPHAGIHQRLLSPPRVVRSPSPLGSRQRACSPVLAAPAAPAAGQPQQRRGLAVPAVRKAEGGGSRGGAATCAVPCGAWAAREALPALSAKRCASPVGRQSNGCMPVGSSCGATSSAARVSVPVVSMPPPHSTAAPLCGAVHPHGARVLQGSTAPSESAANAAAHPLHVTRIVPNAATAVASELASLSASAYVGAPLPTGPTGLSQADPALVSNAAPSSPREPTLAAAGVPAAVALGPAVPYATAPLGAPAVKETPALAGRGRAPSAEVAVEEPPRCRTRSPMRRVKPLPDGAMRSILERLQLEDSSSRYLPGYEESGQPQSLLAPPLMKQPSPWKFAAGRGPDQQERVAQAIREPEEESEPEYTL